LLSRGYTANLKMITCQCFIILCRIQKFCSNSFTCGNMFHMFQLYFKCFNYAKCLTCWSQEPRWLNSVFSSLQPLPSLLYLDRVGSNETRERWEERIWLKGADFASVHPTSLFTEKRFLALSDYSKVDIGELTQLMNHRDISDSIDSTKMAVFWVVTLYRLVRVCKRFRGSYCLHLQGDGNLRMLTVHGHLMQLERRRLACHLV
jgi:hypothetical protein